MSYCDCAACQSSRGVQLNTHAFKCVCAECLREGQDNLVDKIDGVQSSLGTRIEHMRFHDHEHGHASIGVLLLLNWVLFIVLSLALWLR